MSRVHGTIAVVATLLAASAPALGFTADGFAADPLSAEERPGLGPGDAGPEAGGPDRDPETAELGGPARRGFGVRVGYVAPEWGDKEDFSGGVTYGFYCRLGAPERRVVMELGVDLASSGSESGAAETSLVMFGAAALYHLTDHSEDGRSSYVLGGGRIVTERVQDDAFGSADRALGGMLDLGAGVALAGGRADLRATYSFLVGSGNVPGAAGVAVGYSF